MPTQWTIAANGIDSKTNGKQLVGCHLQQNPTNYQFELPNQTVLVTSTGTALPTLPYDFPMFKSAFGGTTNLPWYIRLEKTNDGQGQNQAKGKWSNAPLPLGHVFDETDADTWVTQAGQNIGDPEEASAASASSDL